MSTVYVVYWEDAGGARCAEAFADLVLAEAYEKHIASMRPWLVAMAVRGPNYLKLIGAEEV